MNVFVTGATGYIGTAASEHLRAAGHSVTGLARSDEAARKLEARGVRPLRGSLLDAASVAAGARQADGVVHLAAAMGPDMAKADTAAVEALLGALAGSGKPLVYTSGIWVLGATGERVADEETTVAPAALVAWRPANERRVLDGAARGIRSVVIRPGMVYGRGGGVFAMLVRSGREQGIVRHVGAGENRWPVVHVDDLADLYVRALERAAAGTLLMATAGPSVRVRDIAAAASKAAAVPGRVEAWPLEEARKSMGPFADALALDQQVSSARATRLLGWAPKAPPVVEDLAGGSYRS